MAERPYTVLSCGVSLDGYLDAASPERLVLSNEADLRRVDAVRAGSDAILVGAATVRHDNPRLLVRSAELRQQRRLRGQPESPIKVTVTGQGGLDPGSSFFTTGECEKLVYCASAAHARVRARLAGVARVLDAGEPVLVADLVADLHARGVRRLMVEGGGRIHTQFLTAGLADELHLVVAPFFVGDPAAHRFVGPGRFPWDPGHRARLVESRRIGDVVLLRYALSSRYAGWSWPVPHPAASVRRDVPLPLELADGSLVPGRMLSFDGLDDGGEHLALALGPPRPGRPPLVRLHSECLTGDVLGSQRCDCGAQLREALARLHEVGGYLLYLRQEGRGIGLYNKIDAYALQDEGLDTYQANRALGFAHDERRYDVAAQMLLALGIDRVDLLTNNPDKVAQLRAAGIGVQARVPTGVHHSPSNAGYLAAKAGGGHWLNLGDEP